MQTQKKNAVTSAQGHGAKTSNEAAKLLQQDAIETAIGATHYWDRHSNSVQPIALMQRGICA